MKTQINLTTCSCDLDRFASQRELYDLLGDDGIELTCFEDGLRARIRLPLLYTNGASSSARITSNAASA